MKKEKKRIVGYTAGVFDMFHVGHLNVIKEAKKKCDFLIVAVSNDELVESYKGKTPVFSSEERQLIISALKYVDRVVEQTSLDKFEAYLKYKFDIIFVGEDWKNTESWKKYEQQLAHFGVKVVYIKRKHTITSTELREKVLRLD